MHMTTRRSRSCLVLAAVAATLWLAATAGATPRAVTLPTTFRPNPLNNVVASPTAPVAFVGSRDTDTIFALDPRGGAQIGQVEVGDGPLHVAMREGGGRRLLAAACNGFLGDPHNVVSIVDATDPAAMRLLRNIPLPDHYVFVFAYSIVRFSPDGSTVIVAASEETTASGLLLAYDVATGAERGRVTLGFAPSSADLVTAGG